jgi:hypothetical protein
MAGMSDERPVDGTATTKDMPAVEPRPTRKLEPIQHGKDLFGFYVGLGIVAVLIGLCAWLWTPLRIRYWEREVHRGSGRVGLAMSFGEVDYSGFAVNAAETLVAAGPRAEPAVSRLLACPDTQGIILQALRESKARWALPLLADTCQREPEISSRLRIVIAFQKITGKNFGGWQLMGDAEAEKSCRRFLDWWEGEGKTEYRGSDR